MEQTHTFESLKKKTVAQLREIAEGIEHEAVKGYSQLNKEHLLVAICKALGIDTHAHHHAEGLNKQAVKAKIKDMKVRCEVAIEAKDGRATAIARRRIHRLKRKLRKAMV